MRLSFFKTVLAEERKTINSNPSNLSRETCLHMPTPARGERAAWGGEERRHPQSIVWRRGDSDKSVLRFDSQHYNRRMLITSRLTQPGFCVECITFRSFQLAH